MSQRKQELSKEQLETLAEFRYQLRRYLRFSEEITRREGITPLQYLLLLQIKGFPGREWATISELAERLQSHHHGVVSLITRCERLGMVSRKPNPGDRREVHVTLTSKGERYLQKLADTHRRQLLALQGRFSVPGSDALEESLNNLSQLLKP